MKKIVVLLILVDLLFSATNKTSWTINLLTTDSVQKLNYNLKHKLINPKYDIYIFKERGKYIVTYGIFQNFLQAKSFLNNERANIRFDNPYILRQKYDLNKPTLIPSLIKIIQYSNNKPKPLKEKVVIDNTQKKKETPKQYKQTPKKIVTNNRYGYDISLAYVNTALSGDMKVLAGDTSVDFESDLGLRTSHTSIVPQIVLEQNKHKVLFAYYSNSYTNTQAISRDVILDNYTFSQGSSLNSTVDVSYMKFGYRMDINSYDIGIDLNTIENEINISTHSKYINLDGSYSVLALSVDKRYYFSSMEAFYGLSLGQGSSVDYLEYKLGASYVINDEVKVSSGYEVKNIDINSDNYTSNIDLDSFYIQLTKRF